MRLTPAGAVFASATGLSGIAVVVWFPSVAGAVFCVLAAVFVVAALPLRARPTADHRPPLVCFAGIRTNGSLGVTHGGRLLPLVIEAFTIRYREPRMRRLLRVRTVGPWTLAPRESRTLSYAIRSLRRGVLRFESVELELAGVPPLWRRRREAPIPGELSVYPRPAVVRVPVPVTARGLERPLPTPQRTRHGSEDEFSGLRDYTPGDSIRYIHWRTSFKLPGRLRVKEFAGSEAGHARIILDSRRGGRGRRWRLDFERAVSAAGALWDHLDRQGVYVTLQLPEQTYAGRHMVRDMLDGLARLRPAEREPSVPPPDPGTAVFWVSPNESAPPDEDVFVLNPGRTEQYFQVL